MIRYTASAGVLLCATMFCSNTAQGSADGVVDRAFASLPKPGALIVNQERGEVIVHARIQHPVGKPCIGEWGQRIQAFVGCSKADGADATMAGYFVFLCDTPTEEVHDGLVRLGAK